MGCTAGVWECRLQSLMLLWVVFGLPVGLALAVLSGIVWYWCWRTYRRFTRIPQALCMLGLFIALPSGISIVNMLYSNHQYRRAQRETALHLPYDVYKPVYLPSGCEVTPYQLDWQPTDPDFAIVKTAIRIPASASTSECKRTAPVGEYVGDTWAEVYQMKRIDSFPSACPGAYFQVEYNDRLFREPCEPAGETQSGFLLYQTGVSDFVDPSAFHVSTVIGDTLIIFRITTSPTPLPLQEIANIVDALEILPAEELRTRLE